MNDARIANIEQVAYIKKAKLENGQNVLLVKNQKLSLTIMIDKCLDINDLSFAGENIAFLCKNGMDNATSSIDFDKRFNGGFLYTCGLDNIGRKEPYLTHGSVYHQMADLEKTIVDTINGEIVLEVQAKIYDSKLFGYNFCLTRNYKIYQDKIELTDKIENLAFEDSEYKILYHFNFGYPFLDKGSEVVINNKHIMTMAEPSLKDEELHFVETEGEIITSINSKNLNRKVTFSYDSKNLQNCVVWQSERKGDYAVGIEPASCALNNGEYKVIKSREFITNKIQIKIN